MALPSVSNAGFDAAAIEDKGAAVGETAARLHVDRGRNFATKGYWLAAAVVGAGHR